MFYKQTLKHTFEKLMKNLENNNCVFYALYGFLTLSILLKFKCFLDFKTCVTTLENVHSFIHSFIYLAQTTRSIETYMTQTKIDRHTSNNTTQSRIKQ